ncbi:MAG TPA: MucB/RseB C-terminal domain-containing protein [Usitatibacter sp.]|nr:MucB/RseB C-terminal domain-containing protein [Usitatibacter sp.]
MSVRVAAPTRRLLPALAFGVACSAQAAPNVDPLAWLQRAAQAARQTSYEGVYVHTNGERISTVKVTHVVNGGDEHERIEPLDDASLEIVRHNGETLCRFPDAKTVRLDPRITNRFFPNVLASSADTIAASYEVKLGKTERVLGYQCQWIRLEPRDSSRYAQRLCSELGSGLVVRAKTLNEQHHVIEQYTFTELRMGPQVGRTDLKTIFRARNRQWISDGQIRDEAASADSGWVAQRVPAGFQKIAELRRTMPGRSQPVAQMVFTDGLANLSIFVEPNSSPARANEAASEDGTTAFFVRPVGDHLVSVLGEVPPATVQQVARGVARRP